MEKVENVPQIITDTPNPTEEELAALLSNARMQTPSMISLNDINFNEEVLFAGSAEIDDSNLSLLALDNLLQTPGKSKTIQILDKLTPEDEEKTGQGKFRSANNAVEQNP
jgi:hypothetical protein